MIQLYDKVYRLWKRCLKQQIQAFVRFRSPKEREEDKQIAHLHYGLPLYEELEEPLIAFPLSPQ
jgi:hypothetical protein